MKYRRMVNEARAGDITVHYRSGRWKSVVALSRALTDPVEGMVDLRRYGVTGRVCWEQPGPGWSFEAEYYDLARPIPKSQVIEELNKLEIDEGPIDYLGHIRQAYFMRFSAEGLGILRRASTEAWPAWAEAAPSPQYWVVGASWRGREDQYEDFIRGGYWLLGWAEDEKPFLAARRDRIQPGDRIAVKKISTHPNIEIRAIGIVRRVDPEDGRVYVRWVETDLHHLVRSRGCYQSIHGPYDPNDEWVQEVFGLNSLDRVSGASDLPDLDDEHRLGPEGGRRWRLHLMIERNRGNVERKKRQVKRDRGSLDCEACGFNFAEFYGDLGGDFCEVHHRVLLSRGDLPACPALDDLAIVCSNCHRMIHKTRPMMSVEKFRGLLRRLGRLP
jgi:hypothetical protein